MSEAPPRPPRARRWFARFSAVVMAALVALILGEGALHLLDRARPEPRFYAGERASRESENFVADSVTGWRMRPSHSFQWVTDGRAVQYRSDEAGFRIAQDGGETPPGERLVVCGDSFAFGTGVTFGESFGARVADGLGLVPRNLAMPGFGVDQVAQSVATQAIAERPAVILVALYPEDFDRSLTAFRDKEGFAKPCFLIGEDGLRPQTPDDSPAALWRWLEDHSRVVAALRIAERRVGRDRGRLGWWRLNEALLDSMCTAADDARVSIVFALVPSKFWRPFPAFGAWARARGVLLLDPVADSDLEPSGMYYERDSHLNAEGHRLLGAWFLDQIRERYPQLERQ